MTAHYSFTVPSNYQIIKLLGKGSYGVVCSAINETTHQRVAVKKVEDVFSHRHFVKRALSEIRLLTRLKHSNIISVCDIFAPKTFNSFVDLYWTSELFDSDLHRIISSGQRLIDEHIKYFVYQITCGVRYIHSAGVIHRDLKPANILINRDCSLQIGDFGLAVTKQQPDSDPLDQTLYVQTRWYRAPELLLGNTVYDEKIDIWSLGCMILELLLRKPAFPGTCYMDQLEHYYRVLPLPTDEEYNLIEKSKARRFMRQLPHHKNSLSSFLSTHNVNASASVVQLLEKMLSFNPSNRPSATEILNHPYLSEYKGMGDESLCLNNKPQMDTQFPSDSSLSLRYESKATHSTYKHLLFQEILRFRPRALLHCDYSIPEKEREACEMANPGIHAWLDQQHSTSQKHRQLPSPNLSNPSVTSPILSVPTPLNSVSALSGKEEKHNEHHSQPLKTKQTQSTPNLVPLAQSAGITTSSTANISRQLGVDRSSYKPSLPSHSHRSNGRQVKQVSRGHRSTLSMGNLPAFTQSNPIPFNSSSQSTLMSGSRCLMSREKLIPSGRFLTSSLLNSVPNSDA
ncbi:putative Mitogen-activated protein kinase 5 [Blattamonas nauphoetae]|uniref:Mitogen-activated protein kinase 5 n=1 Tax=Blattamonas nauphoetae TaxID=2049346 RepID=A0ABQ9Y932_9EUKA|nr:putative Mitogen-activated protein kinase 5 [Blattamonas nauphoetae]